MAVTVFLLEVLLAGLVGEVGLAGLKDEVHKVMTVRAMKMMGKAGRNDDAAQLAAGENWD